MRREGTGEETGGEIWDPIGISSTVSDEAMMWFRAAELKHGRVAMVRSATLWVWRGGAAAAAAAAAAARLNGAFRAAPQLASVGYLVGAAGITFPGEIAKGVTFASVNADGALLAAAALAAVPASQVG